MIVLRRMILEDLPIFKKWVYAPHVVKWYHHPLDWIREMEEQEN